jgi:hypothetical protein
MNPLIIVLGIVIVIIIYYFIQNYFLLKTPLANKINLKVPPADISLNTSDNPNSILYSFGVWVYVAQFSNSTLFSYKTATKTYFKLKLSGNNTPTLIAEVSGKNTSNQDFTNTINISTNFPIQKWVHVLVSVDTTYVDCYLDGKLVISNPLTPNNQITQSPSITPTINFSNSPNPDITLAKITRWDHPLDPQSVWNEYTAGNGLDNSNFYLGLKVNTNDYKIYSA